MRLRHTILIASGLALALFPSVLVAEDDATTGSAAFARHKCNLCHGVAAAGIEAKTKSDKLRGPELGVEPTPAVADLGPYLRKLVERNGVTHKREFKGSDEELQIIVDWLGGLAKEAAGATEATEDAEGDGTAS